MSTIDRFATHHFGKVCDLGLDWTTMLRAINQTAICKNKLAL
jgi:hypothetical protein